MANEPPWFPYGPALIDALRSVRLPNGYLAAVLVDAAGKEYLMLVHPYGIGNRAVFDPACATVYHEQPGPLIEYYADRITNNTKELPE